MRKLRLVWSVSQLQRAEWGFRSRQYSNGCVLNNSAVSHLDVERRREGGLGSQCFYSQPSSHSCPEGRYQTFLSFFLIIAVGFCQKNQGQPFVLIWICVKTVNPKENQPWIFTGRSDAKAPILWPPDVKSRLFGKDPDAGTDWGQEEKRVTEDEMAGWHHRLDGHEFEQAPGIGDGQGGLACCSPRGRRESDTTEQQGHERPKQLQS